ncbi:MAG TPA: hypothetical protein VI685_27725 [Candidatus Angelobacter sp.]
MAFFRAWNWCVNLSHLSHGIPLALKWLPGNLTANSSPEKMSFACVLLNKAVCAALKKSKSRRQKLSGSSVGIDEDSPWDVVSFAVFPEGFCRAPGTFFCYHFL